MAPTGKGRRARRPNIHDVAARAGVSAGTVSNVLTGRRTVVPALAARVHAAVARLGYVTDVAASHLRSSQSTVVGVLVPDLTNRFFASFVGQVEGLVRADGYRVLVASSGQGGAMEAAELRALTAWKPAGLIVIPCEDRFRSRAVLAGTTIPVVVADRFDQRCPCDAVRGRGGAPEVIEVGAGLEAAAEALFARLARARPPTAIVALTNTATLAALKALSRRGLRVPQHISLVGFDDDDWMEVVRPAITAVRQPMADMARAAWSRLRERLAGDATRSVRVQLPCALVLRDSTAACATGRPARRNRTAARSRETVS